MQGEDSVMDSSSKEEWLEVVSRTATAVATVAVQTIQGTQQAEAAALGSQGVPPPKMSASNESFLIACASERDTLPSEFMPAEAVLRMLDKDRTDPK